MQTNKKLLTKGIQNMAIALFFIASGPLTLHLGFKLRNYLTIGVGIFLMFAAIFFIFRGLNIIMKALFNEK